MRDRWVPANSVLSSIVIVIAFDDLSDPFASHPGGRQRNFHARPDFGPSVEYSAFVLSLGSGRLGFRSAGETEKGRVESRSSPGRRLVPKGPAAN